MRTPFRKTWYLKLTPELFSLLDVQSGMLLSEQPLLAYKTEKGRRIPLSAAPAEPMSPWPMASGIRVRCWPTSALRRPP